VSSMAPKGGTPRDLLRVGGERRGEKRDDQHDQRRDSRHRSTPPSSASAFSSQNVMPISRYIVAAAVRSSGSRFRVVRGLPGSSVTAPGPPPELGVPAVHGVRHPDPTATPPSGARWAVLAWFALEPVARISSAAITAQNSRLHDVPDSYTSS
jgi:hypothetical protein